MYSMACCRTHTLLIFLIGAAVGTCRCNVSKPLFTVCTLFLSRVFLLIVFKSSWGLITYPWIGWIATSLLRGPITTKSRSSFQIWERVGENNLPRRRSERHC